MPAISLPDTHTGITADILRQLRRRQNAAAAAQALIWEFDTFTISGAGDTTHTLSFIPYGVNVALLNGLGLVEGVDYTVDYTTGIITVSSTLTAGDVLHVRYVTTGELMVYSTPPDTGFGVVQAVWSTAVNQNLLFPQPFTPGNFLLVAWADFQNHVTTVNYTDSSGGVTPLPGIGQTNVYAQMAGAIVNDPRAPLSVTQSGVGRFIGCAMELKGISPTTPIARDTTVYTDTTTTTDATKQLVVGTILGDATTPTSYTDLPGAWSFPAGTAYFADTANNYGIGVGYYLSTSAATAKHNSANGVFYMYVVLNSA